MQSNKLYRVVVLLHFFYLFTSYLFICIFIAFIIFSSLLQMVLQVDDFYAPAMPTGKLLLYWGPLCVGNSMYLIRGLNDPISSTNSLGIHSVNCIYASVVLPKYATRLLVDGTLFLLLSPIPTGSRVGNRFLRARWYIGSYPNQQLIGCMDTLFLVLLGVEDPWSQNNVHTSYQ